MGWRAIEILNRMEHIEKEKEKAAAETGTVSEPPVNAVITPETATAEVVEPAKPLEETHEVISGPGGWFFAAPKEEEEVVAETPASSSLPESEKTEEVASAPVKKPRKSKKASEPTS